MSKLDVVADVAAREVTVGDAVDRLVVVRGLARAFLALPAPRNRTVEDRQQVGTGARNFVVDGERADEPAETP